MSEAIKLRMTLVIDYEAMPGSPGYAEATTPAEMAALDLGFAASDLGGFVAMFLENGEPDTFTIEPVTPEEADRD